MITILIGFALIAIAGFAVFALAGSLGHALTSYRMIREYADCNDHLSGLRDVAAMPRARNLRSGPPAWPALAAKPGWRAAA